MLTKVIILMRMCSKPKGPTVIGFEWKKFDRINEGAFCKGAARMRDGDRQRRPRRDATLVVARRDAVNDLPSDADCILLHP